ncbi:hypothetical protein [Inconstantimicrobium mannanitabidum]|uniref:Uncharacterized protein n=1 Tax=Inconstantimicrobium mannanitabidum TaxID=1604901 RepID=A0ACB5RD37_9CLOT|nr:hypothetical protein [Clostridium sp. TW13]GKX66676.1 hypothetical protein rsdtw13_19340 [Clostridium sp. TW13]
MKTEKFYFKKEQIIINGVKLDFFSIDNLPEEIPPSNCPILDDVKKKICTYF